MVLDDIALAFVALPVGDQTLRFGIYAITTGRVCEFVGGQHPVPDAKFGHHTWKVTCMLIRVNHPEAAGDSRSLLVVVRDAKVYR